MRRALVLSWVALSAGWIAAFFYLGGRIGGVRYLAHVGMATPAFLNLLMAVLSVAMARRLLLGLPTLRSLPLLTLYVVTALHLVNLLGLFLMMLDNGRAFASNPLVLVPFLLLSSVASTNSVFTERVPGFAGLVVLPLGTLLVAIVSSRISDEPRRSNVRRDA